METLLERFAAALESLTEDKIGDIIGAVPSEWVNENIDKIESHLMEAHQKGVIASGSQFPAAVPSADQNRPAGEAIRPFELFRRLILVNVDATNVEDELARFGGGANVARYDQQNGDQHGY